MAFKDNVMDLEDEIFNLIKIFEHEHGVLVISTTVERDEET